MASPLQDRRSVEAAVADLQGRLADGDPEDAALRQHAETVLADLRVAYRADKTLFTSETIEALQELRELLGGAP